MATKHIYTTNTQSGPVVLEFESPGLDQEKIDGMLNNIRRAFVMIVDLKTKVEIEKQARQNYDKNKESKRVKV